MGPLTIFGLMCSEEAFLRACVVSSMGLLFVLQGTSLKGPLGPRIALGQFLVFRMVSVAS